MKFTIDSKDFKTAITKVLQLKDGILSSLQRVYITGEEVTVSIKILYENNFGAECGWINTENNENGDVGYYDLYTTSGLVCMDGETCKIIDVKEDCIVLKNTDGERDMIFTLTYEEANICCFECPVE